MDFRILGPLEVDDDGRQLPLGGARQRGLLAMLLLHANEVVSSDRLIAELWGEDRVDDASRALQVAVSRLRRTLEPQRRIGEMSGVLATRPPGYELRVEPGQLDVDRFQELAAAGRAALVAGDAASAAEKLASALTLWRGPPLADLGYESFSQTEISRLEELRSAAVEDRIAAELELGRHTELVAELQDLVSRHPLRERLRKQLMLALYRCGRQADALAVYQDARRALTDELGIEPGRELRELQAAILRQAPELARDRPAGPDRPDDPGPVPSGEVFVGRERELDALVHTLEDALGGRGRLVLLVGEPGIGKSRLADQLMNRARRSEACVLVGRCWEAGGAPAYWPWVQSLRGYVQGAEPDALRAHLGTGVGELAQLLTELHDLFPALPEPIAQESDGARFRLFEAVSSFLRNAAREEPLVVMLDDLHAADEPSLLLLRFVARQMADSRLLVVCAFRDVDPTLGEPLTAALAELVREPHTTRIELTGLSESDLAEYIKKSTGIDPPDRLVEAIHAETEGNPLFVAEVVQLLQAEDRLADPNAHLRIPPGVRAVIGQRVGRLSERCRSLLLPAAVMGREFGLDALARFTDLPRNEMLDVLDEAMGERVVTDVPGSPGHLRFGHALIRDTLYDELSTARRLQLHRDAAAALEDVYSNDLDPHLAELAHHFSAGSVPNRAFDYANRAGDRAAAQLAFEEATRLYAMALTLVAEDTARCDLLVKLGDAQARAGDMRTGQGSFLEAADLAERLGLPERLASAALGYGGRIIWEVSRGDTEHVPLLERALAALGDEDSPLRVRLLARLGGGPLRDSVFAAHRKREASEEALAMARRIGDPGTIAYAIAGFIPANHSPEFIPTQIALGTELIDVATAAGDLERAAEGYENRFTALLEVGDLGGAKADLAAMAELAKELRQPSQEWFVVAYSALMALLEGDLALAEDLIERARGMGEAAQAWNAAVTHGLQLYLLRREQGRLQEVEDLVRRSVEDYSTYAIWRCVLTQTAAGLAHKREARELLTALAADDFAALPFDEEWLVEMGLLAEAATALGERERAAELYERLVPYADHVAVCYAEISTGCVARPLGLLATIMERWDDAERHFEQALEVNERTRARPWVARTKHAYGQMLSASGDSQRGGALVSEAQASFRDLGMA